MEYPVQRGPGSVAARLPRAPQLSARMLSGLLRREEAVSSGGGEGAGCVILVAALLQNVSWSFLKLS